MDGLHLEFEPRHAEVARESFHKAGVAEKVEVFVGPAVENLKRIEAEGPFDMVFIDADNTFAGGTITDATAQSASRTRALREFNQKAASDSRLRSTILPTSDGLTVSVKL